MYCNCDSLRLHIYDFLIFTAVPHDVILGVDLLTQHVAVNNQHLSILKFITFSTDKVLFLNLTLKNHAALGLLDPRCECPASSSIVVTATIHTVENINGIVEGNTQTGARNLEAGGIADF